MMYITNVLFIFYLKKKTAGNQCTNLQQVSAEAYPFFHFCSHNCDQMAPTASADAPTQLGNKNFNLFSSAVAVSSSIVHRSCHLKADNGLWPGHGHKVGNGLWPGHGHKVGNGFWSVMANQQSDLATWPWLCTWLQVFDEEAEATLPSNSVVYWLVLSQCYGFVQENMTRRDQYSVCGHRPISTWESLKTFTVSCFKEETVQAASKAQS